ncbi:MAG: response regulator [Candidatus Thiodiazotropha sp.]
MNGTRIYIIDDNNDFRTSTSWLLEGSGYEVISFDNPISALNIISNDREISDACCLLDVRMPVMSGLEFHDKLLQNSIYIPVIYMTGHGDIPLAVEAMSKGAITLLEKPIDIDKLNNALLSAASHNKPYIEKKYKQENDIDEEYISRLTSLTEREKEVLEEIVSGKMNKAIAVDLGISVKTVELHRSRVMSKMVAKTPADLVKMFITKSVGKNT